MSGWTLFFCAAALGMLLPYNHADGPEKALAYRVEPYVMAADVYTAEGMTGRAGWSWYTGAAAWWYRTAREDLLGLSRRPGEEPILSPEAAAEGWDLRPEENNS